jgi:UDP-N-acetylglucosamine--N-acetylmuramyl-(pentapeptide) pyrophosphoryl-undecaprenol N-acetylglucosamine transferase
MPETLLAADFVVARCGSGTLAEIVWAQKPAFLIPYPFAAADHQRANAEAVKRLIDCKIFDIRPFAVNAALAELLDFLHSRSGLPDIDVATGVRRTNASAAQQEIIRHIIEEL